MKNEPAINDELIAKYLSGEATPEEAMALHDWLGAPANRLHFEEYSSAWHASFPFRKPSFNKGLAVKKIDQLLSKQASPLAKRAFLFSDIVKVAAAILLLAVSFLYAYNKFSTIADKTVATTTSVQKVMLADESQVTLFRNSQLDFPVEFKSGKREIKLVKGEAFFKISPNKEKPFIVHTNIVDITVVGTEFNVTVTDNMAEVSVSEGKVLLYNGVDSVYLVKGSKGSVKLSGTIQKQDSVHTNDWSYASKKLVFKDETIKNVIKDLEKTFPCSIDVSNDNINNCHLTATFDDDSIEKIVNLIAETLNLTIEKNDSSFILKGDGCP